MSSLTSPFDWDMPSRRDWFTAYVAAWTVTMITRLFRLTKQDGLLASASTAKPPRARLSYRLVSSSGLAFPLRLSTSPTAAIKRQLGRAKDCQIQVDDGSVSRRHCVISSRGGSFEIIDCDSTNGTWVNGQRVVGSMPLKNGDELRVGDSTFVLRGSAIS